jgi:cysteine-rich repeat protein
MQSLWTKTLCSTLLGVGLLTGCGAADETAESDDAEDVGISQQALAPGSNAQFVSSTFPTALNPGERRSVQVVMKNTGTAMDGSNTWTPAAYSLSRLDSLWSWVTTPVPSNTVVGANATFTFVITAPATPATYTFNARMKQDVLFGATASVPNVVVSNATTPQWSCTYVPGSSSVPTTLTPGETRAVSIVVQNTGTATWPTTGTYLGSLDTPTSFWGQTVSNLTGATAPNGFATFNFNIKAPATNGTYSFKRQMSTPEIGFFRSIGCVDLSITVGGSNPLNSALVSQDFPTTMAPGESRLVNVVLKNTGTQPWAADGTFGLSSKNTPASLWGITLKTVTTATAVNANNTFTFSITAPTAAGSYRHRWQMRKFSGTNLGDFGVLLDIPVTVDGNAQPQYGASVVSQSVPLRMTAGRPSTFTIRMGNTGSTAWVGSNFALYTVNSPASLWGTVSAPLGAAETVAANAQRDFVLNVTAPATPGTYDSHWRMRQLNGVGFFGEEAITTGIEVTLCGNSTINSGEVCDDGNLVNGDGCDDTCHTETTVTVNLATDPANRTLTGLQSGKALANVSIGDFSGDGRVDVITGQNLNLSIANKARNQAGELLGYSGTTFYTGGAASLTIYGAEAGDSLGAQGAGLFVGDVTGDGVADIVATAIGADGVSNMRSGCGEVYVFAGGASLTGTLDLAATTPPAALKATVIGAAASNALRLLALGDLTNDGVKDLVLGGPNVVYVVPGGAGLSGNVDLAAPPAGVVQVTGTGLGNAAAVGNFGGSAAADLVVGASSFTRGALTESGAAWGVFGPITAARNVALAVGAANGPNAAWFGAGTNDHFGHNVAVADVLGTAVGDVIITADQQRKAGVQVGAVNIWAGSIANARTFDLSAGNTPSLTILGADQGDAAGSSLGAADWNGDGILDLAVASYGADGPTNTDDGRGELVIIRGSRSMPSSINLSSYGPLFKVYGAADRDLLGSRLPHVSFGDIDGDTAPDLCIGSQKGGGATAPGRIDCFQ